MRSRLWETKSCHWRLLFYTPLFLCFIPNIGAMILKRRTLTVGDAVPVSTLYSVFQTPTPSSISAARQIPLWDQCGLNSNEVCAGGAQCICKDPWWSQCRTPVNDSWTPLGEAWECSGPKTDTTVPYLSSPPAAVVHNTSTSRGRSTSPSVPASTSVSQTISFADNSVPSNNIMSSQFSSYSNNVRSTTPSSARMSTVLSQGPISTPPPTSSSANHDISINSFAKATTDNVVGPPTNESSSVKTLISGSASWNTSSTSLPSSPIVRASAYANPFVISILAMSSSSSSSTSTSIPTAIQASQSAVVVNVLPQPSSTTILPNLACPSPPASGGTSNPHTSDSAGFQACDPNTPVNPGNLSLTTNSFSTPSVPQTSNVDPDRGASYLESNATADHQAHCLDFAAHQYQICWEVLNVTGYLSDWVAFNQKKCDNEVMGFADCFLYLEVGAGANCTSFTGRSQCPVPDSKTFVGHTNGAQAYYVAFNIWNIQNWFFTYYMAVGGANGLAADNVNTIARTLNLPLPKSFPIMDLLAGLAWAFGLLSPSGYAAALPLLGQKIEGLAAQAPGEYLLRAIQNAPTLSRNLIDRGQISDTEVQVAELGSDLARIVSQLQTNIQSSVVSVMSNFSIFFDFVHDGYFSTQIENLNTLTHNVTLSLNTYIVSQALQNDHVIITRALDTDVNQLQLNGSAVQYDTGCGHGYDQWGMCGSWWYDSTNHISYGLESMKDMLINYTEPLVSLFNQGITTPQLLFMNSQFCADASGSTQGNAPGSSLTTTTGVWNTQCISNMKICTWDLVNMDVFHEYTDCDRESSFAMENCGAGQDIVQATVPASYIGPWLTSWVFQGIVCNKWGKGMGNPG